MEQLTKKELEHIIAYAKENQIPGPYKIAVHPDRYKEMKDRGMIKTHGGREYIDLPSGQGIWII